jgi:hypothetical protein
VMMSIIGCPTCQARNRVGRIAQGVPRCPRCKSTVPWVVEANADTFAAETTASVPVVVDFWAALVWALSDVLPGARGPGQESRRRPQSRKGRCRRELRTRGQVRGAVHPVAGRDPDGQEVDRIVGRFLALRWSSGCGQCSPPECAPSSAFRDADSPAAGRMLVGKSDRRGGDRWPVRDGGSSPRRRRRPCRAGDPYRGKGIARRQRPE